MQGDADEKDQSSEISFDAVQSLMNNTGYPAFNYDVFKRIYDDGKTLKNVVADFNQEKIVNKTDQEAADDPDMDFETPKKDDNVVPKIDVEDFVEVKVEEGNPDNYKTAEFGR